MIIQCNQCRTKFRFDDSLMGGDGVWVRCGHCQHVFFSDNPKFEKHVTDAMENQELPLPEVPEKMRRDSEEPPAATQPSGDEDVKEFLSNVLEAKDKISNDLAFEMEKTARIEIRKDETAVDESSLEYEDDKELEKQMPKKRSWKILKIVIWSLIIIIVIPAIVYFVVFPQMGERLLKIANKYVNIGVQEPTRPEIVTGQVKLQDIRQRILNNYVLGPVRIVEGTAVNQADYPISRILIKGEIVDAYAVVLGERSSYAGNVLMDEELTTMAEDEMLRRISVPEGRNNSNDKIMPNGQIPFMIIFTREPAGAIKTTVTVIGAERLL
jgi:predicted Zn finger-like uncharacterized protein